jgi:hypothetical protein
MPRKPSHGSFHPASALRTAPGATVSSTAIASATVRFRFLLCECAHDLCGNVQEKDGSDERDGEDDDDEWVAEG